MSKKIVKTMSKKMFFKNMSKNVCQDNVCQDQVCQDHICQDHVCQLVLSTCFGDVNMLFQCPNVLSMSTYFVYMFCQHALSTSYDNVNMFCNMLQFSFIMNRISTNLEVKHINKAMLLLLLIFAGTQVTNFKSKELRYTMTQIAKDWLTESPKISLGKRFIFRTVHSDLFQKKIVQKISLCLKWSHRFSFTHGMEFEFVLQKYQVVFL